MINLNLSKEIFAPKFYPYLLDYSHRWLICKGSAGSGKSYFITQKIIVRCLKEQIRVLVCRRYGSTIRNTCFSLFKDILKQWQLLPYVKINETDFRIRFPNGSEIIFQGLDEETKLLSLNNITVIFIEEVFEVPKEIVEQLNLRLRGQENQEILMAFNPISKQHWLYDFCMNPPQNSIFLETTYKDNPFLSKEYVQSLEELRIRNPRKAKIYCDGEWGTEEEGLVFQNFVCEDFNCLPLSSLGLEHRAGCDLGFIDPTTVIDTLYDKNNHTIYCFNEFYKSGCQLEQVAKALDDMNLRKTTVYFDSAEPRSIDYFKKQGFWAQPCIKGQGSVKARIEFLQNNKIVVNKNCPHLLEDLENFSYKKDKLTGQYIDDEFADHRFSHTIDALGYAYSDIYSKSGLHVLSKSILGL